jgi:hypothetical protein
MSLMIRRGAGLSEFLPDGITTTIVLKLSDVWVLGGGVDNIIGPADSVDAGGIIQLPNPSGPPLPPLLVIPYTLTLNPKGTIVTVTFATAPPVTFPPVYPGPLTWGVGFSVYKNL